VTSPNPRVLQRLADVLDVSYRELMELTGYLMPVFGSAEEAAGDSSRRSGWTSPSYGTVTRSSPASSSDYPVG